MGHNTYFVVGKEQDGEKLSDKDAISVKKCLVEISKAYSIKLREFS
jgi:hypothetical protein